MREYFNDSPIDTALDDRYGVLPFAQSIARSLEGVARPIGTTIALHGPWGSGKSSVVNLVRGALKPADKGGLIVTEFKCWWYRGEEALALAFLQNLNAVLQDTLGQKVKGLIPDLTRGLLRAGPVVGQAISLATGSVWASLLGPSTDFSKSLFPDGKTVEETFKKLADALDGDERRFLVIIDDIDRLSPDEAVAIFRLVKSVGRLPNVLYLLVFDRMLADRAVANRFPSEGPHFLEKIIQASFELPGPLQADLHRSLLTAIERICGSPPESRIVRTMNLFYDIVVPYMKTPRHVVRFENAISVTWPAVANEVELADFLSLEALRLYEPGLYQAIKANKDALCGSRQREDREGRNDERFKPYLAEVPAERADVAKRALLRLFPRMESTFYDTTYLRHWDQQRRVCMAEHFDTYFRLSLGEGQTSQGQIEELIRRADDKDYIRSLFRRAAATERPNGQSMVPVYLSDLTTHGDRVALDKLEPLLSALFEIHDEIALEKDQERGFGGLGNTSLRYHWVIRALTRDRLSLEERSKLYVSALANASPGWLAEFTRSAFNDYDVKDDQRNSPRECLVREDAVPELVKRTLETFRSAAADGTLLSRSDLRYDLYLWKGFLGDAREVRAWTDSLLDDDDAIVTLAKTFTTQSWSMGLGFDGLGDRVSKATTQAAIEPDTDIIDFPKFRSRLEEINREGKLEENCLEAVRALLTALDRPKHRGNDDDDDNFDGL